MVALRRERSRRQHAMSGFTVLLTARDPNKSHITASQLADKEGLDVIYYLLVVTNKNHIEAVAEQVEQQFGRLDVLVNNAAIFYDTWLYAIDADLDL